MMLVLKDYQRKTMQKLSEYLEQARLMNDPAQAFSICREAPGYSEQYKALPELLEVPYICLRLPTGGGKTILSAYAIPLVTNTYIETDYPIVLWLAPTDIIRKQTIETLKNPRHPNREALDDAFEGRVRVFDITEFTQLRPADIGNCTCVFVATFAAFRVQNTEGRKIYAHHEELEPHFSHIPKAASYFQRDEHGELKYSFANLLAYYRPLVLIDEAHNHASSLSVEVLQRVRPSAIVEFTATPATNSNVLYKVSAAELKAEEMIKLPVVLTEHQSWEDAVTNAIQTRQKLEILARNEEEYIRPIVLFQAENKDKEITVEVLRRYLIEQENIPPEEIAVATGEQRELDGINLFDPNCPVKYIITVQALKEGWDCSFAYVLCSTAKVQSSKDAEQLLGRVLRMPYARRRKESDLNRAYAHVSVTSWSEAVNRIHDNLVNMGFEQVEAETSIEYQPPLPINEQWHDQREVTVYSVESPDTSCLNMILQGEASVEQTDNGMFKTTYVVRSHQDLEEIERNVSSIYTRVADREKLVEAVSRQQGNKRLLSPSERGERIIVPQLCLDLGEGYFGIADREAFLPNGWSVLNFPVELDNFIVARDGHSFEIDINGTKIYERHLQDAPLDFAPAETNWNESLLVAWLDKRLKQEDITHTHLMEFLRRHLRYLQEHRRISFADLVRLRYLLEKALRTKIAQCREKAYENAVQNVLFNEPQQARVTPEVAVVFQEGLYPANSYYNGSFKFNKHFFPTIASMNPEEIECAKAIDMNSKVKTWVRNVECQPKFSFWLPTSKDLFYPDFVAKLADGRILVVEYKGEHLVSGDDTKEKDMVGQFWARQSGGKCLFLMAVKKDDAGRDVYQQVEKVIN